MRRPQLISTWWPLIPRTITAWLDDNAPSMGAALAYYTVFSLGPTLLIVISVAGLFFGADAVSGSIFGELGRLMGPEAAAAIQGMLAAFSRPAEGITGTVVGLVLLVVGATTVFAELQNSLDRIWRAPVRTKATGIVALVRARLISFGMILAIAFMLVVSLVVSTAISALGEWWAGAFGSWEVIAQAVNLVFGLAVTTASFAMIYKIMPRVKIQWHDVWLGAAITAVLFSGGQTLVGLYIGKTGIASGFGAAGSLVLVLVWVYYSAQIFLLGAEFTWVYARTFGSMRDMAEETKQP